LIEKLLHNEKNQHHQSKNPLAPKESNPLSPIVQQGFKWETDIVRKDHWDAPHHSTDGTNKVGKAKRISRPTRKRHLSNKRGDQELHPEGQRQKTDWAISSR